MDQMIKPECVDFKALIMQNDNISVNYKSKMIETLTKEFTEEESKWYIANLYVYMNYHPTNDFPINLDTLVKIAGFAHKKNAKRTLENNFTKDEDYKIRVLPKEQSSWGGSGGEEIMLNTDTFKNMCMLVKTSQAKEIRKYYVKLENIYNGIVKEEIREQKLLQENTQKLLEEKENQFEKEKDNITLNSFNKKNIVYFIQVDEFTIKFGETADIVKRFSDHRRDYSDQIKILYVLESLDKKRLETLIKRHIYIKHRLFAKIFNGENKTELIKVDDKFNIKNIIRITNQLNETINFNTEDKREFDLEFEKLQVEKIKEKTKQMTVELFRKYFFIGNNMETIQSKNMETLVEMIFSTYPKPPCTYTLQFPENIMLSQITLFQILMNFLIAGARKLYGNNITPEQISEKQFQELKYYVESIGYMIKYNYKYGNDTHEYSKIINIWFEKYFEKIDCHGRKLGSN